MQSLLLREPLQALGFLRDLAALIADYAPLTETEYLLTQDDLQLDVPFQPTCPTSVHYSRVTLRITNLEVTLTCRDANGDDVPRMRPLTTLQQVDQDLSGILCACRGSLAQCARQALLQRQVLETSVV